MSMNIPPPHRPSAIVNQSGSSTLDYPGMGSVGTLNTAMAPFLSMSAPSYPGLNTNFMKSYKGQAFKGMQDSVQHNSPYIQKFQNCALGMTFDKEVFIPHQYEYIFSYRGQAFTSSNRLLRGILDAGGNSRGTYISVSAVNHLLYTHAAKYQDFTSIDADFKRVGVLFSSGNSVPFDPAITGDGVWQDGTFAAGGEVTILDHWSDTQRVSGDPFGFQLKWFPDGRVKREPHLFDVPSAFEISTDDVAPAPPPAQKVVVTPASSATTATADSKDEKKPAVAPSAAVAEGDEDSLYDVMFRQNATKRTRFTKDSAAAFIRKIGPSAEGSVVPPLYWKRAEDKNATAKELNRITRGFWNYVPVSFGNAGFPESRMLEDPAKEPRNIKIGIFVSPDYRLVSRKSKPADEMDATELDAFSNPCESKNWTKLIKNKGLVSVNLL